MIFERSIKMNIFTQRIPRLLIIGVGFLVLVLAAIGAAPTHGTALDAPTRPEITWTYLDQHRVTVELAVVDADNNQTYGFNCPVEKLTLQRPSGEVIAEVEYLQKCYPDGSGRYLISQTFNHDIKVQRGESQKLVLDVRFNNGDQTSVNLEILPAEGLTLNPNQKVERNGVSAELVSLEVSRNNIDAMVCFDLPDTEDWWGSPYVVGQELTARRGTLLHNGDADIMQKTHRCYRYYMFSSQGFDIEKSKRLIIKIDDLRISLPEVPSPQMIENANRRLTSKGVQFKVITGDHSGRIEIVTKPAGMSDAQAQQFAMDALPEKVIGPWVFSVELP